MRQEIGELESKLSDLPDEIIHIEHVKKRLLQQEVREEELEDKIKDLKQQIKEKKDFIKKSEGLLKTIDIVNLNSEADRAAHVEKQVNELLQEKSHVEKDLANFNRQTSILDEVPCGTQFVSTCKFIKDANSAKQQTEIAKKIIEDLKEKLSLKDDQLEKLDLNKIKTTINGFNKLTEKKKNEEALLMSFRYQQERLSNQLGKTISVIEELADKIRYYEGNKELLENTEKLYGELGSKKDDIEERHAKIAECEEVLYSLIGSQGALEQKLVNLEKLKAEKERLNIEYSAYDLFMSCMHSNGIAFDIIKKALPVINQEIDKILSNVVDFQVFFENNEKKLDILIKHPAHDSRPLENGSGAEKTLAAIAIRIALLSVSNMPKPNIFILDEPGTALDADNMEGFVRILDLVKDYFDITLLITHIESLKDIVDMTVDIMKTEDGYAYVNQ